MSTPPNPPANDATLRDVFAASALQGFCSNIGPDSETKGAWYEQIAVPHAYKYADFMLAEREKSNE